MVTYAKHTNISSKLPNYVDPDLSHIYRDVSFEKVIETMSWLGIEPIVRDLKGDFSSWEKLLNELRTKRIYYYTLCCMEAKAFLYSLEFRTLLIP